MIINLAEKARPQHIQDIVGQDHLLAKGKPLYQVFENQLVHSMVLWGPPGSGKTTIASLLSQNNNLNFIALSAVLDNIQSVRSAIQKAKDDQTKQTVLFIDEVHRFNKAQQDAFLPHIEKGTIIFIGATTENPSFELNRALLSRLKVYVLNPLTDEALAQNLKRCTELISSENSYKIIIEEEAKHMLIASCGQDARRLLNSFELAVQSLLIDKKKSQNKEHIITKSLLKEVFGNQNYHEFDKRGDIWFNQISALHKSVRGTSPDGALYWYTNMILSGCDPLYIARRLLAIASEDIGNADPRALPLALAAWQTYERLGSAEGERAIAHACVYLACAPKSNSIDSAFAKVKQHIKENKNYPVPIHLRNAPTQLMKDLDYGSEYRYAHNEEHSYAAGECYLPEAYKDSCFYKPKQSGLEIKIATKLNNLKLLDKQSNNKRYE